MKLRFTQLYKGLIFTVLGLTAGAVALNAQVTPNAGSVQCFQVGNGGLFTDTGGPGGNDNIEGAPGNYPNCDCVTTTTLCSPDGSAIQVEFTSFGVNASFDWLVILDTDNPSMAQFPASVLGAPGNVGLQLFNNADGAGDGGAENYGLGAQVGVAKLNQMAVTTYTATNPTGCLTFVFRASAQVDDSGWEALISTTSNAPHPGNNVPCGGPVSCAPPSNLQVTNITETTALVSWNPSPSTNNYVLEYGPQGFIPGTGITVPLTNQTNYTITGLVETTTYDVYIQAICANSEVSALIGPTTFTTCCEPIPSVCNYTLNLYDSFGDGWNGSTLTITHNGATNVYTFTTGFFATFTIPVTDGLPFIMVYAAGAFQNEVTYELLDSDGNLLFANGPFPTVGQVYNQLVVCPDCPGVSQNSITITNIDTTSAQVNWTLIPTAVSYIIEYGPEGFPPGVGLVINTTTSPVVLTGLNPCVNYQVYITAVCEPGVLNSDPVGPIPFMTLALVPCTYTLNMFDSFGDGWNGSFLTVTQGGMSTNYTLPTGNFGTAQWMFSAGLPVTISFTPGAFLNETSYQILDQDNNLFFQDGPFPQTGVVLDFIPCPGCVGPTTFFPIDINADNARFGWNASPEIGQYKLEYGPLGFTHGTGTVVFTNNLAETITGLTENTWYDIYVFFTCDDGESAKTLGPITFKTLWYNDVGVSGLAFPTEDDCDLSADQLIGFYLQNFGQNPQSLIPFNMAINGVLIPINFPSDGLYTGVIGNDSTELVIFETTYDFSMPGYYLIEIWTSLGTDSDLANDTFRYELITAYPLPLQEDFESGVFPEGWQSSEIDQFLFAPNHHNNPTHVISDQLNTFNDQLFQITTARYGPLGPNDSLSFDYRYVNSFAGTVAAALGAGDKLEVLISTDCGDNFSVIHTINQANHVPSALFKTVTLSLAQFAGEAITVRFLAQRLTLTGVTYWIDLDNINVSGCPVSFFAQKAIVPATGPFTADGSIKLTPVFGTAPYSYVWSTGSIFPNATDLAPGEYMVTITDAKGCSEVLTLNMNFELPSAVRDIAPLGVVTLWPNPTNGLANLQVEMTQPEDLEIQVYNTVGQPIMRFSEKSAPIVTRQIDLSHLPAGMYFIRVSAGTKHHLEKLILTP
jgi:hypothetical protein